MINGIRLLKIRIITNDGSVQVLKFHYLFKKDTKPHGKQNKDILDMAADRGIFICQSQSLNLFVEAKF